MDDLVVRALQEGRVDRGDRLAALERQPGGEQDRLLLGDADVEVAVRHLLLQDVQAGAGVHRRGDPDDPLVASAFVRRAHRRRPACTAAAPAWRPPVGPASRPERRWRSTWLGGVPLLHALEAAFLGGRETLALDRRDVDDDGTFGGQRLAQRLAQGAHVVAVDHAHVGPVELLPPQPGRPEGLDRLLQLRAEPLEVAADADRQLAEPALDAPRARATASGSGARG